MEFTRLWLLLRLRARLRCHNSSSRPTSAARTMATTAIAAMGMEESLADATVGALGVDVEDAWESEVDGTAVMTDLLAVAVPTGTADTLTVAALPVVAAPTGAPATEVSNTSWVGSAELASSDAVLTALPW